MTPRNRRAAVIAGAALLALAAGWAGLLPTAAGQNQPPPPPAVAAEIRWLEERSMLREAREAAALVSGHPEQWRHPYGTPQPHEAVRHASVWLLDYPGSVIPRPGRSVIATWADPALWDTLHDLGIELLHTGPIQRAGGVKGMEFTPSLDGWFDRISLDLDPALGSDDEYARLVEIGRAHV